MSVWKLAGTQFPTIPIDYIDRLKSCLTALWHLGQVIIFKVVSNVLIPSQNVSKVTVSKVLHISEQIPM